MAEARERLRRPRRNRRRRFGRRKSDWAGERLGAGAGTRALLRGREREAQGPSQALGGVRRAAPRRRHRARRRLDLLLPAEDDCSESPRGSSPAAARASGRPSASFDARLGSSSGPDDDAFAGGGTRSSRSARAPSCARSFAPPSSRSGSSTSRRLAARLVIEARASASFAGWAAGLRGVADAGEGTSGSFDSDPDWRVEGASERAHRPIENTSRNALRIRFFFPREKISARAAAAAANWVGTFVSFSSALRHSP